MCQQPSQSALYIYRSRVHVFPTKPYDMNKFRLYFVRPDALYLLSRLIRLYRLTYVIRSLIWCSLHYNKVHGTNIYVVDVIIYFIIVIKLVYTVFLLTRHDDN